MENIVENQKRPMENMRTDEMKDRFYFPHDYHARHDPKIERLFLTLGYEGIGIYWCLIEMLYEQDGRVLLSDLSLYAKDNNELEERLKSVIKNFELFVCDKTHFWSKSVLGRLSEIKKKRDAARGSAERRWDANAMRTQCERNAIKESKVKERNKYIEQILNTFRDAFLAHSGGIYISNQSKDRTLIVKLLKQIDPPELKELIGRFFESRDKFIQSTDRSFGVFYSQINKLRQQKTTPKINKL